MKIHRALAATCMLASQLVSVPPTFAQEADAEPPIEAEALASLQAAFDRLEAAKSVSFRVNRTYDVVQASGQKLQFGTVDEVLIRRPDRIRLTLRRDDGQERRLFYDGAEVVILDVRENAYARLEVPPSIDEMLDFLELQLGSSMPLADFLYNDLSPLIEAVVEGAVVGKARIDDQECEHLAFRGARFDLQVWTRPDHEIRKILITDRVADGAPQLGALFRDWNFKAKAPDTAFVFEAPKGSERIPVLARPARVLEEDE